MTTRHADIAQQASANAVVDLIDSGTTNAQGRLRIYDDTAAAPASANDAVPGGSVLLSEHLLSDPAYGSSSLAGVAALAGTPIAATAVDSGEALWFRIVDKDTDTVIQGDIRATADPDNGEELVLDNTNIALGQTVNITSLNYTSPANES